MPSHPIGQYKNISDQNRSILDCVLTEKDNRIVSHGVHVKDGHLRETQQLALLVSFIAPASPLSHKNKRTHTIWQEN